MKYTYNEYIFSDLHKEACGFRPDYNHEFYTATPEKKEDIWNYYIDMMEEAHAREVEEQKRNVQEFKKEIKKIVALGAKDWDTALRWMTTEYGIFNSQDAGLFVYNNGLLGTDFGNEVKQDLTRIYATPY